MKNNFMRMISLFSMFGIMMEYVPSYADQMEHDEVIEESLSLPFSVKYALKQLCLVLKNDGAEDLIPHVVALVNQKEVDNELVEQGLQEAMICAGEILSQENITKSHKAMLAYIKKTIEDYHNFLILNGDEAEYRSRPYHTPALFNGPVFITDVNDPQGYAALTVNGLANFTDVNIETVTIDTLNVGQENVANLTVSNSLVLSYLSNNADKFLYLSDNTGTVQSENFPGIEQVKAGNNISITGTTHSPVVNVSGTTTNAVQIGSPNGALHSLSFGTSGYVLTSQGTNNSPQWKLPSSALTTIDGDTGFVTPVNSAITFNANSNAGATVKFSGSGSTMDLLVTSPTLFNTFIGLEAGSLSTTGSYNTAIGYQASHNNGGSNNVGVGYQALANSGSSNNNVAVGYQALVNDNGSNNVGVGYQALASNTGNNNTVVGYGALTSGSGSSNIVIGFNSGSSYIGTESNNILIGNQGVVAESGAIRIGSPQQNKCYIEGVFGVTLSSGAAVYVNSSGQLGTLTSSRRYKDNIVPVTDHNKLMELEPVQFTYKTDGQQRKQYGLIAESVYEIYPELVVHNAQGEIETVRYDQLNALLLKEFQDHYEKIGDLYAEVKELKHIAEKQQQLIESLLEKDESVI